MAASDRTTDSRRRVAWLMLVVVAAISGVAGRADGPQDNLPDIVRAIPPVGIELDDAGETIPLSLFDGLRTDFSLARLAHYTGTRPEDFQRFNKGATPAIIWLNAADVVRDSLNHLGSGRVTVVPGWQYKPLVALLRTPLIGDALLRAAGQFR